MAFFSQLKSAFGGGGKRRAEVSRKEQYEQARSESRDKQYHKALKSEYQRQEQQEIQQRAKAVFAKPKPTQSVARQFVEMRKEGIRYGQRLRQPIVGPLRRSGRVKYGRGRPAGPSGRYIIPGVGPVGVYEYRKWFSNQL
jgi:hypothetical protein